MHLDIKITKAKPKHPNEILKDSIPQVRSYILPHCQLSACFVFCLVRVNADHSLASDTLAPRAETSFKRRFFSVIKLFVIFPL